MKKFSILIFALLPLIVQAQKIDLFPKVSMSYCNEKMRITDEENGKRYTYTLPNICFRTGLEARYKNISAYYDMRFWCDSKGIKYEPEQAVFEVGISYQIIDKIKIALVHNCYHACTSDRNYLHPGIYGGKDEIVISYGY